MKKCPECDESFDDHQSFCDMDGSPLLDDIAVLQTALQNTAPDGAVTETSPRFSWSTALIGVLIGIIFCLIALTFKVAMFPDATEDDKRRSSLTERSPRPAFSQLASTQKREPTTSPEPEPTPSEEVEDPVPEPSPAASIEARETVVAGLNNGPISTGLKREGEHGRTLIKLKDGSSVTADAAWEDSQGVWYRRGGLVSFVDRDQVAVITDVPQPKASSEANSTP